MSMKFKAWKAIFVLLFFSIALWLYAHRNVGETFKEFSSTGSASRELSNEDQAVVELLFKSKLSGTKSNASLPVGPSLQDMSGPVVIRLWRGGRILAEAWEDGGSWGQNLSELVNSFPGNNLFGATSAEIEFCYNFEHIDWQDKEALKKLNIEVGLKGLEMFYGGVIERSSPHKMAIKGDNFQRTKNRFLRAQGQDPRANNREGFLSRSFNSTGLLINLDDQANSTRLTRANALLEKKQTYADVTALREGLVSSFATSLNQSPRLPYMYYPVNSEVSYRRELAVRPSLGIWSLGRLARIFPEKSGLYETCLKATLRNYYSTDGTLGFITPPNHRDNRAIGEIALFAMALHEGPLRNGYRAIEDTLLRTTDEQWNEDGSFRCFIGKDDTKRGIEYYPGETLVYWAALYKDNPDPERLRRIMKSFEFYRNYHLNDTRKAAFVPWQTQAFVSLWHSTKNPELADFVFEMNDWLAEFSLWENAPSPDLRGAIWDPNRPEHGSAPHVSSTGVYLEGMAQAYKLAVALKDKKRADRYKQVIQRGIFSLRQHQYSGFDDLYYIPEPERVRGQLRGQLSKQAVRIDNNSHSLLALLALTEIFEPTDYEF